MISTEHTQKKISDKIKTKIERVCTRKRLTIDWFQIQTLKLNNFQLRHSKPQIMIINLAVRLEVVKLERHLKAKSTK